MLGSPAGQTPTIIVGGTNGKGTVCGYAYHLLSLMGLRVGLYTSPHLCHFRERIQISDRTVNDADIVVSLDQLRNSLTTAVYDSLSFFEIATLIGFKLFADAKTDVNVLEVGMGGRWDATNLIDADVAAIVSIGLDHMGYLGDTVEAITLEKAPIARKGRPLFWGGASSGGDVAAAERVGNVLQEFCKTSGVTLLERQSHFEVTANGEVCLAVPPAPSWHAPMPNYFLNKAPFQRRNFPLAAALVRRLFFTTDGQFRPIASIKTLDQFNHRWETAWQCFGTASAPMGPSVLGRFQPLVVSICSKSSEGDQNSKNQHLLLDVCHNIDGVIALKQALHGDQNEIRRVPALVSILGDKDVDGILDLLRGFLGPIVLFRIPNDRSFKENQLADRHRELSFFESFETAFAFALGHWQKQLSSSDAPWVVCGSLAAVGEVLSVLEAAPQNFIPTEMLRGVFRIS